MKTVYHERNRKNTPCREEIQMTSGKMYHLRGCLKIILSRNSGIS